MSITRRDFIRTGTAAAAAAWLSGSQTGCATLAAEPAWTPPDSGKLRFAQIGCGGRGKAHWKMWKLPENSFVAACDADRKTLGMFNEKSFPDLRRYTDHRELFANEADNIDAVVVATPDHTHYPAAMQALQLGKAVYCEKPLAWSVQECLDLADFAATRGIPTQMGNQGNAGRGWRDIYAIVHSGIVGDIESVHTWSDRPIWPQGQSRPEGEDPVPDTLDWDSWIGVAPMRPFKNRVYHPFRWRGFSDFGCGALGDMACHIMNAMFQVMKPGYDLTVEPLKVKGRSPDGDQFPKAQIIKWAFDKRGSCPGFDGYWYDGRLKPDKPSAMGDNPLPNTGSMFIGTRGVVLSSNDYNSEPSVYTDGKLIEPKFELMHKLSPGFHEEFLQAANGQKPWDSSGSNFSYAGKMTAIINMGTIAERIGKKLRFSAASMKFTDADANALMSREPRRGWAKAYTNA